MSSRQVSEHIHPVMASGITYDSSTGMLASAETIEMVEKTVTKHNIPCLVVDPVSIIPT